MQCVITDLKVGDPDTTVRTDVEPVDMYQRIDPCPDPDTNSALLLDELTNFNYRFSSINV